MSQLVTLLVLCQSLHSKLHFEIKEGFMHLLFEAQQQTTQTIQKHKKSHLCPRANFRGGLSNSTFIWGNRREEISYDQSHDTASHKAQSMQNKHSGKRGQENCSKCFMASEITRDTV